MPPRSVHGLRDRETWMRLLFAHERKGQDTSMLLFAHGPKGQDTSMLLFVHGSKGQENALRVSSMDSSFALRPKGCRSAQRRGFASFVRFIVKDPHCLPRQRIRIVALHKDDKIGPTHCRLFRPSCHYFADSSVRPNLPSESDIGCRVAARPVVELGMVL